MNLNLKQKHLPGETLVTSLIKKVVFACQGECVTEKKTVSSASTRGGSRKKVGVFLTTLFFAGIFFVFGANTAHANFVTDAIEALLNAVFAVVGFLVGIATIIFAWVLKPENFAAMMNMASVKSVWIMVRDFLNMAFILVLLFAAFCTVFQVEKWNLKKVWLGVLINALLVNFSFPIARFFIDISNIVMYYFLNNMFAGTGVGGDGVFAGILAGSELAKTFEPPSPGGIKFLLMAIIFTFIFGMTLLVLASMFVVRMIALTILVMFSPVGFVGYIFPSTHKYADMWWENLMKYCFSGPVMVFMIMVALSLIREIQTSQVSKFVTETAKNSKPDEVTWLASAAFMIIPIVVLWFGIGIAQSFGIAGAKTFTEGVKNGGKKLAMALSGGNYLKKNYDAFAASRKKRAEEINKKRWGGTLGDWANDKQDNLMAAIGSSSAQKRRDKRNLENNKDDIKKEKEAHEGHSTVTLVTDINAAITSPPANKSDLIKAAGKAREVISRGKEFEMEIEAQINSGTIKLSSGAAAVTSAEKDQAKREYFAAARKVIQDAEKA